MPIEQVGVSKLLQLTFATDPPTSLLLDREQLYVSGAPACVCPNTGQWLELTCWLVS
jgi:hypothetical protein